MTEFVSCFEPKAMSHKFNPYEILQILCDRHRASGVRHRAVPAGPLFWSPNSTVSENTNTGAMSLGPVIGEVTGFLA